jgi:hypothetical protein
MVLFDPIKDVHVTDYRRCRNGNDEHVREHYRFHPRR